MTTGVSVFLAALGAILAFAVRDSLSGVDLTVVGYILILAGVVGLLVSLMQTRTLTRPRTTSVTEHTARTADGTVRNQEVETR